MKMETQKIELQEFTRLPVKVVVVADRLLPDVLIQTPHEGTVQIKLRDEHYSLFGGGSQMDEHSLTVIKKIRDLEQDAKEYLLTNWLDSNAITKK